MCELFGISGKTPVPVNAYLKELASHSREHPNGWGMAVFYRDAVNLEKEPIMAIQSNYLQERLRHPFEAQNMFAHIRLATKGGAAYENTHPFVKRDASGRAWTLIHNGTIFDCYSLDPYVHRQKGSTDSERILLYIIDRINARMIESGGDLCSKERFEVLDQILCEITRPNNKVNLLVYDSELTYVHTNMRETLYYQKLENSTMFATVPLCGGRWKPLPFTRLLAWKEGRLVFTGRDHGNEYIYDPEDMKYLYLDHACL